MGPKRVYLGIAGVYSHDSAAALVIDGKIVADADAVKTFTCSGIDALLMEDTLLTK